MQYLALRPLFLLLFSFALTTVLSAAQHDERSTKQIVLTEGSFNYTNGKVCSNSIVVKFRRELSDVPQGANLLRIEDIRDSFPVVKATLRAIESAAGPLELRKHFPHVKWGDTVCVNKRTNTRGRKVDLSQVFTIRLSAHLPVDSLIDLLEALPDVEYAHQAAVLVYDVDPNDPKFTDGSQWHLQRISAPQAWGISTGSSQVTVGLIDHGAWWGHSDLQGKIAGGHNVASNHGTQTAGVVGALTNNSSGVASLGWNIRLYPLAGISINQQAHYTDNLITEAAANADVINMSFGTFRFATQGDIEDMRPECPQPNKWVGSLIPTSYLEIEDAIENALSSGVVCVASAGNGSQNEGFPGPAPELCDPITIPFFPYPAGYEGVISCTATRMVSAEEQFVDGYNYNTVTVAAPGVGIWTTDVGSPSNPQSVYANPSGTSFSAPQVAALSGLILSVIPVLTPEQVRTIITSSTDKVDQSRHPDNGSGWNAYTGYGRINAYQALLLTLAEVNKSQSSQSTSFNGQRKLYRESAGKLHEVFSSGTVTGGEIFYRNSTNGGVSWSNATRLSDGTATSLAPCITMSSSTTNVIVTWQQTYGSNYNVVFRRSTNGGTAWGSITTLQSNFSCGSPGPLPSVSGNTQTSRVVVIYRSSSGLRYVASSNNMTSWTAPAGVPGSTSGNHNSPSTAYYANDVNNCNLAFATDVGSSSVIDYSSYTGSWSAVANLSSVLPSSYQWQRKPTVATTASVSPPLCHVAWEATDVPGGSTPVLIHRKGTSGNFGSQYSVINYQRAMNPSIAGLGGDNAWMVFQNTQMGRVDRVRYSYVAPQWVWGTPSAGPTGNYGQISVGSSTARYVYTSGTASPYTVSLGSESLSKDDVLVAQYSRELNLIDGESGASLTLEIEQAELICKDGTITAVPFKDAPPDSLLIPVEEIFTYGETKPFAFPSLADTLKMRYTVRCANSEKVVAEDGEAAYTFTLRERKTGGVLSTLKAVPVAKTTGMTSAAGEITLPGIQIQGLEAGAELILEVSFSGVKEGQDLIASLGHIYRYKGEGAEDLPKPVAEENSGPKSYHLQQNYPNPFNPSTTIRYGLPEAAHVRLIVYNTLGQQVADLADGEKTAGYHDVKWEAAGLASGIYFARLTVTGSLGQMLTRQTTKLVLMR